MNICTLYSDVILKEVYCRDNILSGWADCSCENGGVLGNSCLETACDIFSLNFTLAYLSISYCFCLLQSRVPSARNFRTFLGVYYSFAVESSSLPYGNSGRAPKNNLLYLTL